MDILAATYTYRTTTYVSPDASVSIDPAMAGAMLGGIMIMAFAMLVIGLLVNMALTWGVYKKAGYKGWEGVVPFYNNYCLYKMSDVSMALFIISIFIPIVNIYMYFELAKKFGKEPIWGLGLFFLPIIFMPILGYGSAEFQGVRADGNTQSAPAAPATPATPAPAPAAKPETKEEAPKEAHEEKTKESDDKTTE